jgi:hypothetical protein
MNEITETIIFCSLMDSLDSAFAARQNRGMPRGEEWGERLFAALKEKHPEWAPDIVTVYSTAHRMLFESLLRRAGAEFGTSLSRNPEGFLSTVLMVLRGPSHSLN